MSAIGVSPHEIEELVAFHVVYFVFQFIIAFEHFDEMREPFAVAPFRARCGGANHLQSDLKLHRVIGFLPLLKITMPSQEMIDPCLDGEKIEAELFDAKLRAPPVVHQRCHAPFRGRGLALMAMQNHRGKNVVTVREHVRLDENCIAGNAFRWKAALIDGG